MKLSRPRTWPRTTRLGLIIGVSIFALVALILLPAIPLGPHYHDFADKRTMFGIPNAQDVLSNIPFVLVGVWGFVWLLERSSKARFLTQKERIPYQLFFLGVALTGIGSFWYHLAPSDFRLPWDLLPMTCSFISMVVAIFMERIDGKIGLYALIPALLLGIASVVYWYCSEMQGHGNYKYYLFIQFFSPVASALMIGLFPPKYSGMRYLVLAFGLFVLAKLFESFDRQVYLRVDFVDGHALKHLTAGIACYWILRMLQVRHPIAGSKAGQSPRISSLIVSLVIMGHFISLEGLPRCPANSFSRKAESCALGTRPVPRQLLLL
jgi:hypothetical protein